MAFSAIRENKRLIGVYFGGKTGKQRDQRLKILMDLGFEKLNISGGNKIVKQEIKEIANNNIAKTEKYKIVVGTFKYKKNAEKHLKLIKKKYPKTTNNKESKVNLN